VNRRSLIIGAIAVVAVGAVAIGAASTGVIGTQPDTTAATDQPQVSTATVTKQTLESVEELDGTLGFEGSGNVVNQLSGTVTKVPEAGTILGRGDEIIEVDGGTSSYLMYGARPSWRTLGVGVDHGPDVKQLERNLQALGYLDADLKPDQKYGKRTETAVEGWQDDIGEDDDGVVRLGEVVFLPGSIRLTTVPVQPGTRVNPGQTIATYSFTDRIVTVSLDADRQDIIAVGDKVTIELPDGIETPGSIADIAAVATPATEQGGSPQIAVKVTLDDPATSGTQDGAPVTVKIVRERRDDVLTVPVQALVALAEGGFAVEVVDAGGSVRLVAVTPGLFSGSAVEVQSNQLSEGDRVVIPS